MGTASYPSGSAKWSLKLLPLDEAVSQKLGDAVDIPYKRVLRGSAVNSNGHAQNDIVLVSEGIKSRKAKKHMNLVDDVAVDLLRVQKEAADRLGMSDVHLKEDDRETEIQINEVV